MNGKRKRSAGPDIASSVPVSLSRSSRFSGLRSNPPRSLKSREAQGLPAALPPAVVDNIGFDDAGNESSLASSSASSSSAGSFVSVALLVAAVAPVILPLESPSSAPRDALDHSEPSLLTEVARREFLGLPRVSSMEDFFGHALFGDEHASVVASSETSSFGASSASSVGASSASSVSSGVSSPFAEEFFQGLGSLASSSEQAPGR